MNTVARIRKYLNIDKGRTLMKATDFNTGKELWEALVKETREKHGAGFDLEDWDELPASEQAEWDAIARGKKKGGDA